MTILFSEKQRFTQWWLWLIIGLVVLDPLYMIIRKPGLRDWATFLPVNVGIPLLIFIFFRVLCLHTRIGPGGISVRFSPFHRKWRFFSREDIRGVSVRKYRPLLEYGGWGLRYGLSGKGRAYTVSGNMGIQIIFRDGRKLLIGTRHAADALQALQDAAFPEAIIV